MIRLTICPYKVKKQKPAINHWDVGAKRETVAVADEKKKRQEAEDVRGR